ncbi:gamma-glutamylcyclotransferase [Aquihabitans sp. G128]|uniref:gamma-glutamylcyclotransferase family protein n=1 Tax=Aquihabitans sp. G128 TaxID=2849779 RepID=UPI001C244A8E|nr:gamma-glutamylcyclotransferase family protein [Aquihabitans sp. G128]QXC60385.1 gamma-glutamylcyclotransferase [Aquihabitans sp. G128]
MLAAVFVYGTLMPGHLRWGLIAPSAVGSRPASVEGQLYDTGQGWPAARFTRPLGVATIASGAPAALATVPGWWVELAPGAAASLLGQLDEVEGAVLAEPGSGIGTDPVPGGYRRVRVLTAAGDEAWAYEALEVEPGWVPVDAWVGRDEN